LIRGNSGWITALALRLLPLFAMDILFEEFSHRVYSRRGYREVVDAWLNV